MFLKETPSKYAPIYFKGSYTNTLNYCATDISNADKNTIMVQHKVCS